MRALLLAAVALLALVPAPPALAQAAGAPFYEDPEGDTTLSTFGIAPDVPLTNAETAPADLRSLVVTESDEAITFVLGAAALETTSPYTVQYRTSFAWRKVDFQLECTRRDVAGLGGSTSGWCYLYSFSEKAGFLDGADVPATWDVAAATVTVALPKVMILDEERRTPTKDDVLSSIDVASRMYLTAFGFATQVRDSMGEGAKGVTLQVGDLAKGYLKLTTQDRVRVSNGGATTFVFQANLTNSAEVEDTVRLTADNVPEGWNVTVQSPLRVPAQGGLRVAVLVSVPFGHQHGGFDAFNLTAQSDRDPGSRAALRLGVLHTPIPQPAGHHSELYLHARNDNGGLFGSVFTSGRATMNTEAPTDEDAAEAMATWQTDDGFSWEIPLDPTLRMGLDFDLERLGELTGKIRGRADAEATLTATLHLVTVSDEEDDFRGRRMGYDLSDGLVLATGEVGGVALTTSGATDFAITLEPTVESDYVPYAPRQNLVLVLEARWEGMRFFCCVEGVTPTLETEAFLLTLPLNEYHDKLTGAAEAALAVDLEAKGPVEKPARPGTVMTYVFELTNPLDAPLAMEIDVAGNRADLGTVVPDGLVEVPAKGSVEVTLAVQVPHGAAEGEELEVLVFAHARDDPSKMAVGRTKTLVTLGSGASPDETGALIAAQERAAENDAPGPGVALVALAILGAALAARRRRA